MGRSVHLLAASALAAGGIVLVPSIVLAGPFVEAGIPANSPLIKGWATSFVDLVRGPQDITNPGGPAASFGAGASALGGTVGSSDVVSLGDGGRITLTFATQIGNGVGADLAIFENAFVSGSGVFAELAFVEVSSNGSDYVRFPSVSLTQTTTQVGSFGTIDPTNVLHLAGKHVVGQGTPFDLGVLVGASPSLNVNAVTHVRLIDVVGTIGVGGSTDSLGVAINDPFKTPFASGGFDLDAVAVLNVAAVPEPTGAGLVALAGTVALRRRRGDRPV